MSVVFAPSGATVNVAAPNSSSTSVALSSFSGLAGGVVRVHNGSTQIQFVEFGAGAPTATTSASLSIPAGGVAFIEVAPSITHAAAIEVTASTGAVYFTCGQAR